MKFLCKVLGHKSSFVWWMSGIAEAIASGHLSPSTFEVQYENHKHSNFCMRCGGQLPVDLAGVKLQLSTLAQTFVISPKEAEVPKRFLISS